MGFDLRNIVLHYAVLLIGVVLHEWAHAKTADVLGDPGPRSDGRLSLNPGAHFDLFGTGVFPLLFLVLQAGSGASVFYPVLGWGRFFNPTYRGYANPPRDEALVMLAGPLMNLLLCFALALLGRAIGGFVPDIKGLMAIFIAQNALLFAFNLLPVPPLDGAWIIRRAVGMSEQTFMQLASYGFFILILINLTPLRALFALPAGIVITLCSLILR